VAEETRAAQQVLESAEEHRKVDGKRELYAAEVTRAQGVIQAACRARRIVVRRSHLGIIETTRKRSVESVSLLGGAYLHHRESPDVVVGVDPEAHARSLADYYAERRGKALVDAAGVAQHCLPTGTTDHVSVDL
jgi:hypothetical protein